jgi:2,4-dienoyl-CoA reductase-like NADH-dependent reductase (Old Yellow Enzyme family)/thioredoxin reductase
MKKSTPYPYLFQTGSIGQLKVPNRIVMSPMATSFANVMGEVTESMVGYYAKRARGKVGLIIVENANVDYPTGISGTTQLRVDQDRFIPGLYRLTQIIHAEGALCALQINHAGAVALKGIEEGAQPIAPSEGPKGLYRFTPKIIALSEIEEIVSHFAKASQRVKMAGFDAVEIHGAHAYLIAQFLSPLTNRRQDSYGGDIEGRARFAREIITEARKLVGPDFPIIFRMDVCEFLEGGIDLEESIRIAQRLEGTGVNALNLTMGTHYRLNRSLCAQLEPMSYGQGWRLDWVAKMKSKLSTPVIAVGPFREPNIAEDAIREGKVDFVSLGRALIADPFWARKASEGKDQEINRCISCNEGCVRSRLFENHPVSCTVNPETGWENQNFSFPVKASQRVMVIGGGPAGCSTAIYARERGHEVFLLEREPFLGGNCLLGSRLPHKENLAWFVESLSRRLRALKVDVRVKTIFSTELLKKFNPTIVIFAIGAEPYIPRQIEVRDIKPIYVEEIIRNGISWSNRHVAIIGGGALGCESGLAMAGANNQVTILEALNGAARDIEPITRFDLLDRISKETKVDLWINTRVRIVEGNTIHFEMADGKEGKLETDHVIWATGYRSRDLKEFSLEEVDEIEIKRIGDCLAPRNIFYAVSDGFWLGSKI